MGEDPARHRNWMAHYSMENHGVSSTVWQHPTSKDLMWVSLLVKAK